MGGGGEKGSVAILEHSLCIFLGSSTNTKE